LKSLTNIIARNKNKGKGKAKDKNELDSDNELEVAGSEGTKQPLIHVVMTKQIQIYWINYISKQNTSLIPGFRKCSLGFRLLD
jgi:hypothetical protein